MTLLDTDTLTLVLAGKEPVLSKLLRQVPGLNVDNWADSSLATANGRKRTHGQANRRHVKPTLRDRLTSAVKNMA